MSIDHRHDIYMRRALELAMMAEGNTTPNPMVGAVIVAADGRVIGEGYHRRCGEGHAEVNAIASVGDPALLRDATIYVSLEPCSHYGKTPPCARLIIDKQIPRVVVGTLDPFDKVAGRGVAMLRDAGVEVTVLDDDIAEACRAVNHRFMCAHTLHRPFVTLKWACSADGWMDNDTPGIPARISTPLSGVMVHRLRSHHDAIITGSGTVLADNPRMNVRSWGGESPRVFVLDRRRRLTGREAVFSGRAEIISDYPDLPALLQSLYSRGITSVLVEAGPAVLQSFIDAVVWDEARVEISPDSYGAHGTARAPRLALPPEREETLGRNRILTYRNRP